MYSFVIEAVHYRLIIFPHIFVFVYVQLYCGDTIIYHREKETNYWPTVQKIDGEKIFSTYDGILMYDERVMIPEARGKEY